MTSIGRGFRSAATVALAAALAMGCQGGGTKGEGAASTAPRQPEPTNTLASLIASSRGDQSQPKVEIPTAEVGEPTGGLVKVTNDQGEDLAVSRVSASSDSGRMEVSDDTCTGASLPPGGSCEVTVRHVAAEPGPYTGALAVSTSLGTLSAPLSGEAVGAQPPAPTGMETSTPEGTPTETGSAEPPSDGTDTTQSPPVDEPAYAPPRPR